MSQTTQGLGYRETLRAQGSVLIALMLRDVKTRFGASAWGFLLAIGWPLSHSMILLAINSLAGRAVPYGESGVLWFATGTTPYVVFQYMARWTMLGLVINKPLMVFPIIKPTDIMFARAIVEFLSAGLVIVLTCLMLAVLGVDFKPTDLPNAFEAIGASMLLGLGFGILNGIIAAMFPMWITGFALLSVLMWILSGVIMTPDALPEAVQYYLSFNPLLQVVEWTRSAYYPGYGAGIIDKGYTVGCGAAFLFAGLLVERLLRGKLT